jgi:VanZ family protein
MTTPMTTTTGHLPRPWQWHTVSLVVWLLFVSYASMAPPAGLPSLAFRLSDKLCHAAMYLMLAVLMLRAWGRGAGVSVRAAATAFLAASVWGYYLECLQALTSYRSYELMDFAFDALGAGVGAAAFMIWIRLSGETPRLASTDMEGVHS